MKFNYQTKRLWFLSLFFFYSLTIIPQSKSDEIIATIGGSKITANEFKLKYELSPYLSDRYDVQMIDSLKMDFLYSLIAERLLAQEAIEQKLDTLSSFRFYFKPLEDILMRDLLFKEKIEKSVSVTDEEMFSGIKKYSHKLKLKSAIFRDSSFAFSIDNIINEFNFDSLLNNNDSVEEVSLVEVTFNSMKDRNLEERLFDLKLNEITLPTKTEAGWVLFRLINKETASLDITNQETINAVKSIIKNRKIKERYSGYLKNLLSEYNIKIKEEAFDKISDLIIKRFNTKSSEFSSVPAGTKVYLNALDFKEILQNLENDQQLKIFSIEKTTYTLFDFLSNLAFEEFGSTSLSENEIRFRISERMKSFIQQQILTREGYKNGLNLYERYVNDISMWKNNYLAHKLKNNFIDSIAVSDSELKDHYSSLINDSSGVALINVRMITSQNLDDIASILDNISSGITFQEVALKFGKTNELVNERGETGLKPVLSLGEIGRLADKIKLNEIYGPITFAGGYTLFQIMEKKESKDSALIPFADIKTSLLNELKNRKLNNYLTEKVLEYSTKKSVKIFPESVESIKVTKIPMFVHRLMGFGGRISAVPITSPWSMWIDTYKLKQKIIF